MRQEARIIEAFKASTIRRILIIDDAYDPPMLNEDFVENLADFLESSAGHSACGEAGVRPEMLKIATRKAHEGELESGELEAVHHALFVKFIETRKKRFDPKGNFELYKGIDLDVLKPLIALLLKCDEAIEVRTTGLIDGIEHYQDFQPQVLFLDYVLDAEANVKSELSLTVLKELVSNSNMESVPTVVLMSSKKFDDVDEYRHKAEDDRIMAVRFQFLGKQWVRQDGQRFDIDHAAADVLLDTSQGYVFGKVLQEALTQWKTGATEALNSFMEEVGNFQVKDLAYLLRFRLRDEEQPLSEYLEWFFGECLRGLIDKKIDWHHVSFSRLDGKEKMEETIEGAFDGPSDKVAEFFHRVRVNNRHGATTRGYRLGDLYVETNGSHIRAVITPDCDLVVRGGKPNVTRVLTMGGTLTGFDEDGSAADDFLFRDKTPCSVRWNPKDLHTFPIEGRDSLLNGDEFQFLGTLRPLYAQEMQRRALTDLSRVGLPVAPAFAINATATAWIRTTDTNGPFEQIVMGSPTLATIVPTRAGQQNYGHIVLLRRRFFNELIDRLNQVDRKKMKSDHVNLLNQSLKNLDKLYNVFLRGCRLKKGAFGIRFVFGENPVIEDRSWLQIVLEISKAATQELQVVDPFVRFAA